MNIPTGHILLPALEQSISSEKCVAIIGAAVSTPCIPLWDKLIDDMIEYCEIEKEQVAQTPGPENQNETRLLESAETAKNTKFDKYCEYLDKIFGKPVLEKDTHQYHLLYRIKFKYYINLNFDNMMINAFDKHATANFSTYPNLNAENAGAHPNHIFHVHGLLDSENPARSSQIVLTKSEFNNAYNLKQSELGYFLKNVLRYNDVCFIGCNPSSKPIREIMKLCQNEVANTFSRASGNKPNWFYLWDDITTLPTDSETGLIPVHYPRVDDKFLGFQQVLEYLAKYKPPSRKDHPDPPSANRFVSKGGPEL